MSAPYLGDFPEDHTGLTFFWNSNAIAGESITRATNGTVSCYKDGGTTQSTAGITDTEDFDSLTGVHKVLIDTSADAFYVAGAEYAVILSAATIDGKTINAVLAHFSIERAGGVLALLKGGTNGLTAIKNAINTVDDFLDTEVAAIKAKTDNLPPDPADASDIAASFAAIAGYIDTEVAAILAAVDTEVAAIKTKTDQLTFTTANCVDSQLFGAQANTITASALATDAVTELINAIWDEALAGHATVGTAGKTLSSAGSAGDPWSTALPGAYGAGTAGKIIGDNINATLSSRASQTSVDTIDDFVDSEVSAIKTKTDQLTFTVANQLDSNPIDKTGFALTSAYDYAKGTVAMTESYAANGVAPTPIQATMAIHQMLMQFAIAGTSYTVKKLNNSTTAFVVTLSDAVNPTGAVRT